MKKNIITALVFIAIIFIMKKIVDYISSKEFNDSNLKKINKQGQIVKFQIDSNNHNIPVAVLKTGETMNINFIYQKLAI